MRCYWELFGEYVRNLGTLCFDTSPLPPLLPTRKKREPLHSLTQLLIWLHGNSITKIGCHYFWPGLIALPKNTLPIIMKASNINIKSIFISTTFQVFMPLQTSKILCQSITCTSFSHTNTLINAPKVLRFSIGHLPNFALRSHVDK